MLHKITLVWYTFYHSLIQHNFGRLWHTRHCSECWGYSPKHCLLMFFRCVWSILYSSLVLSSFACSFCYYPIGSPVSIWSLALSLNLRQCWILWTSLHRAPLPNFPSTILCNITFLQFHPVSFQSQSCLLSFSHSHVFPSFPEPCCITLVLSYIFNLFISASFFSWCLIHQITRYVGFIWHISHLYYHYISTIIN